VSAHDSRGNDSDTGWTEATPAEAERRSGRAGVKDDLAVVQHEQQHGHVGSPGRPDAEMRPADVQIIADERGRTHSRWEALDRQPKGLQGTDTHAESSQPPRENHGPRRPGHRQTEEGCQSAGVGDRA
jgi:hypothetical protein